MSHSERKEEEGRGWRGNAVGNVRGALQGHGACAIDLQGDGGVTYAGARYVRVTAINSGLGGDGTVCGQICFNQNAARMGSCCCHRIDCQFIDKSACLIVWVVRRA